MQEAHLLHFYHLQSFTKLVNCWISRINHCSTIFPILPKQLWAYCWISPLPGICVSPQAAMLLPSAEPRSWPGLAGMNGATPTEEWEVVEDLSGCPGLVAPWLHTKLVAHLHHRRGWGLLTISLYPLGRSFCGEPIEVMKLLGQNRETSPRGEEKRLDLVLWTPAFMAYASRADIWNSPADLQKIRSFGSWQGCQPFYAAVHKLTGAATCSSLPPAAKPHGLERQAAKPAVQQWLPLRMGCFSRKEIGQ